MSFTFANTYARLPDRFFVRQEPAPVPAPQLIRANAGLAVQLGIDPEWLASAGGLGLLSGQALPVGAEPIALAYAGHQFGHFVAQLGDGRALLIGEVVDAAGRRWDVQVKGSGRTAFSRGGDGKAALGPVLREYVVSEAMAALGVPSARALGAVLTGETVWRETALPGAMFTRVAASHLRVGTFQYFAAREDYEAVQELVAMAIERHYPAAAAAENRALALLEAVIGAQAELVAQWLQLGFIHGVMNTDNVAISGETIDFGPCAFMDAFHPQCVYSAIDRHGRYAWGQQPTICQWNLTRLAETLLPLLAEEADTARGLAEQALGGFADRFQAHYLTGFRAKLGWAPESNGARGAAAGAAEGAAFVKSTLATLAAQAVDFTLFFRHLTRVAAGQDGAAAEAAALFREPAAGAAWLAEWQAAVGRDGVSAAQLAAMRAVNPVRIPRNHRVEEAIRRAHDGDFGPFHRLVDALAEPYAERPEFADLELAPLPHERVTQTFCGT